MRFCKQYDFNRLRKGPITYLDTKSCEQKQSANMYYVKNGIMMDFILFCLQPWLSAVPRDVFCCRPFVCAEHLSVSHLAVASALSVRLKAELAKTR